MKYMIEKNYDNMSEAAAQIFAGQIKEKPDSVLGLATGTTPLGLYDRLAKLNKAGKLDFSRVRSVNLDEYCGLPGGHVQSYRYFMDTNLFDKVNIDKANTNVPNGMAEDFDAECARYDELIDRIGIDVQLLGIGDNGHIGFNEPGSVFYPATHRVQLTEATIKANSRLFDDISEVPGYALTMGVRAIMQAKKVVLIAGASKRKIVDEAMNGLITPEVQASILQCHRDVTVIIAAE